MAASVRTPLQTVHESGPHEQVTKIIRSLSLSRKKKQKLCFTYTLFR